MVEPDRFVGRMRLVKMEGGMKVLLAVVAAIAALFVLVPLLKMALGLFFTVVNVAVGLIWLAVVLGVIIFVVGLVRRLLRV